MKAKIRKLFVAVLAVFFSTSSWVFLKNRDESASTEETPAEQSTPLGVPQRETLDQGISNGGEKSKQELVQVLIEDLDEIARPDLDEAIADSEAGLLRSKNIGIRVGEVRVRDASHAREVLLDRGILNASLGPCFLVESDSHFFFSGLYRIDFDKKGEVDLKFRIKDPFKWGWAVRKHDGEVFRWNVLLDSENGKIVKGIRQEAFRLEEIDTSN
ncbi:hypothetical protein [Haloferula sp.]|uniref:hypothetical protein n=1 Tax=Haloferula sp. TaxID=2497595 RepID=UPI003C731E31